MLKVAVLMGGTSQEREISMKSGNAVAAALERRGYQTLPVVLNEDSLTALPDGVDAVFIALHGGYGENGGVQADLDARGIAYTGPGAAASRLAMDKIAAKKLLVAAGIPTAEWEVLRYGEALRKLNFPVVVKPPREGSSVGVAKVNAADELPAALSAACAADALGEALVEGYIAGREWTVGIIGEQVLPVVEILAPDGWYGFEAKYTQGLSHFGFPDPDAEGPLIDEAQRRALSAYDALGCRGVSRVDFRITPDGTCSVLEVNTVPGMTSTSLLPRAAARAGLDFDDLCSKLVELSAHD